MRDLSWSASLAIVCALFLFVCGIVCIIAAARAERRSRKRLPRPSSAADRVVYRDFKGKRP
jgi:hypothetical protein